MFGLGRRSGEEDPLCARVLCVTASRSLLQALVLYVRVDTAATRLLRVERTVCEVQLVLRCFLSPPQAMARVIVGN